MFKFVIEFIGSFILFYIILESYNYNINSSPNPCGFLSEIHCAFGTRPLVVVVGVLIKTVLLGSISGVHIDRVTAAMMYGKNVSNIFDVVGHIIAQILGGLCAYKLRAILKKYSGNPKKYLYALSDEQIHISKIFDI